MSRESLFVAGLALADLAWLAVIAFAAAPLGGGSAGRRLPTLVATALGLLIFLSLAGGYRTPRRWRAAEAVPAVSRALVLALPLLAALALGWLGPAPFGPLGGAVAGLGLLAGLIGLRLTAGCIQGALLRRGFGRRRALIIGDAASAAGLAARITQHGWLGERVAGYLGDGMTTRTGLTRLGDAGDLAAVLRGHAIDVVWLAPPADGGESCPLPPLFFEPGGAHVIWRILPEDFARGLGPRRATLEARARATLDRRLRRDLALDTGSVAMIGSRGVPASYSGVERYVEEVGGHLAAHGVRVAVYCRARYVAARGWYRGMELRFVPAIPSRHLETISHVCLATLHALLREEQILHFHALGPATLAWLPRLLGRRVVVTVQGLDWQRAKWGRLARCYLRLGEWASARLPHLTIVVSRTLAAHYAARYGVRLAFVPNGFVPPVHRPPNRITELGLKKDGYLLFVGRLVPEKGCHTLIRAYARLATDKALVIAGAGVYEDSYVQRLRAEAHGLPGVRFVGFVRDALLDELYSNAYVVVHPTQMEGLSIALLEAVSHGNCVLVSHVPENLEVAQDAGASFRVDDADDLARHLQRLLDHPHEVEARRVRARALAATFPDWDAVGRETRRLYATLAGVRS